MQLLRSLLTLSSLAASASSQTFSEPPIAVDINAEPSVRRMMKDTIRVSTRLGAKGTSKTITRLLVEFDDIGRKGMLTF